MNVQLIDFTGRDTSNPARYAANILVFTKGTRLAMNSDYMKEVESMCAEEITDELQYMANTIPSSWEFVDYTFLLDGVSRAFTAQLCRTRSASFAERTLRIMNVGEGDGWEYYTGPSIAKQDDRRIMFKGTMQHISRVYKSLIEFGAKVEDARGILPLNIKTRICMKIDLRNFVDMVHKRSSPRVQGEYREFIELAKAEVMRVHPWSAMFLNRTFDRVAQELDEEIGQLPVTEAKQTQLRKLVDQLRYKQ